VKRYKEIRVCGKCLREYTEDQDVSPCCKEAGFYLILERNGMTYFQGELVKRWQDEIRQMWKGR